MVAAAPTPPLVPLSIGKYAVVRFLGTEEGVHAGPDTTGVESYIVRAEAAGDAAPRLILERARRDNVTAEDFDAFTRRARRIAMLRHPNVPRVRDVFTTAEHAVVVTEFIDGKRWGSLDARAESHRKPALSLEVRLKLLLDSISALAALHALREPGWSSTSTGAKVPSMVHGDVTPSSILVGTDGVARLLRIHRTPLHPPSGPLGERTARCAPEILLGDGTADGRADVYSVGVMLWEALSGKRLFTQPTVAEMLSRQLAGDLPTATTSVAWAEPLVDIAAAALAVDPKRRYATAIDLAMAIRNVAGHRVAGASEVARQVAQILGNGSGARKVVMPPQIPPPLPTKPAPMLVDEEREEQVDLEEDLSEFLEPAAAAPVAPVAATAPVAPAVPELEAIDDRWSSLAPEPVPAPAPAPISPPVAAPVPLAAAPPPFRHAPLRMTPAPTPPVSTPPANTLRPSDITELQARSPRRKRQILIVMFLAALLLFVTVCTTTLLLRSPKAPSAGGPRAATSAKPVESAAAPNSLAVATPAPPAAPPEPAPTPTPDPTPPPPPPVTKAASPAPSPPARATAPGVRRPAASVPATGTASAPAKVTTTPAPKAAAPPKTSPPPPPAARAPAKPRPKRSPYVPLGI